MACEHHIKYYQLDGLPDRTPTPASDFNGSVLETNVTSKSPDSNAQLLLYIEQILLSRVTVAICACGVLGNFITLIVLRQRRRVQCKTRSVTDSGVARMDVLGLMCLSTSDLIFCLSILPFCMIDLRKMTYSYLEFSLYYDIYSGAVINSLILTSTWLTVTLTLNRYVHLCHPLQGRRYFGALCMTAFIVISIVFSISFNLLRFWMYAVSSTMCTHPVTGNNFTIYTKGPGIVNSGTLLAVYSWSYFIVGISLPLCILAYCNCRIIRIMYHSMGMEIKSNRARTLMTKVLICIVIFYLLLVSPAELIKFFAKYVAKYDGNVNFYNLAVTIGNMCQAINFAFNFMPYLVLDKKFRYQVCHLFCRKSEKHGDSFKGSVRTSDDTILTDIPRTESQNGKQQQKYRFSTRQTQFD